MNRFIFKEKTFLNALLCIQNIYLYHTSDDGFAVYYFKIIAGSKITMTNTNYINMSCLLESFLVNLLHT